MAQAHYRRSETDGGIRYDVTPAPWPGMGCMLTGATIIAVGAFIPGVIMLVMGGGPALLLLGAVFWGPAGYCAHTFRKADQTQRQNRKPATIIIQPDAVVADGRSFPREDIYGFAIRHAETGDEVAYSSSDHLARAQKAGQQIGAAMAAISNQLILRRHSDSQPVILVHGLDGETGHALAAALSRDVA